MLPLRVAALALLPIAISGCDTAERKEAAAAQRAGESWILVEQGERPPEDDKKPAVAVAEKEEKEEGFLEIEHGEAVTVEPVDARCTGVHAPGRIAVATVTPAATTAKVTWYHPGDPAVTTYKVTAISQSLVTGAQPEIGWTDAAPGEGCHEVTATVTGLQGGTPYVFSVDAVRKVTWRNGIRTATVARSTVVSTN